MNEVFEEAEDEYIIDYESDDELIINDIEKNIENKPEPSLQEQQKINNFKINWKNELEENKYLDLSLYVISGILLIFILDQFVNIGWKLKMKQDLLEKKYESSTSLINSNTESNI